MPLKTGACTDPFICPCTVASLIRVVSVIFCGKEMVNSVFTTPRSVFGSRMSSLSEQPAKEKAATTDNAKYKIFFVFISFEMFCFSFYILFD